MNDLPPTPLAKNTPLILLAINLPIVCLFYLQFKYLKRRRCQLSDYQALQLDNQLIRQALEDFNVLVSTTVYVLIFTLGILAYVNFIFWPALIYQDWSVAPVILSNLTSLDSRCCQISDCYCYDWSNDQQLSSLSTCREIITNSNRLGQFNCDQQQVCCLTSLDCTCHDNYQAQTGLSLLYRQCQKCRPVCQSPAIFSTICTVNCLHCQKIVMELTVSITLTNQQNYKWQTVTEKSCQQLTAAQRAVCAKNLLHLYWLMIQQPIMYVKYDPSRYIEAELTQLIAEKLNQAPEIPLEPLSKNFEFIDGSNPDLIVFGSLWTAVLTSLIGLCCCCGWEADESLTEHEASLAKLANQLQVTTKISSPTMILSDESLELGWQHELTKAAR